MKRLLTFFGLIALVALGFGLGLVTSLVGPKPLVPHQDAVVQDSAAAVTLEDEVMVIGPETGEAETLFIFYPGGLVRPQAYEWLGVALAPLGVQTLIPVMPLDLAVLAPNRAAELLEDFQPLPDYIVIGGHSLGGAMAARYALKHPDQLDGLVLMGAFSANNDDLSGLALETLVIAAENDGLATVEEVQAGLTRLPDGVQLELITGSVHSFFGRYGPQRGDGLPSVTRADAEAQILSALRIYFSDLIP